MTAGTIIGFILGMVTATVADIIIYRYHERVCARRKERPPLIIYNECEDLAGLKRLLATKDTYTEAHSQRVAEYAKNIAKEMGWKGRPISDLYKAAMLHDIGKVGISEKILNKKGKLTNEEYQKIKDHPIYSEQILRQYEMDDDLCETVRSHHERWDGHGYPDGLKEDEIPIMARIIAVADAYDAMVTARPYRKNLSIEKVMSELKNGRGTQFDPDIIDIFCKMLSTPPESFGTEPDQAS